MSGAILVAGWVAEWINVNAIGATDPWIGLQSLEQIDKRMNIGRFVPVDPGKDCETDGRFAGLVSSAKDQARQPIAFFADLPETCRVRVQRLCCRADLEEKWQQQ